MLSTPPWIFRGQEPIWRNGLQCDYPPPPEGQPLHPWSEEGSGENISPASVQANEEKNTNVRVIFMDKQFETPHRQGQTVLNPKAALQLFSFQNGGNF